VSLTTAAPRVEADFYARPVLAVARDLIGCTLLYDGIGGVIVETEAYHQSEPACHAYRGPTPRAKTLFDAPGTAYVYFSYGVHALLNAVAEPAGVGAAVLIRALCPTHGIERMIKNRARDRLSELCSGPGKLTEALGIGLDLNESSLIEGPIAIHEPVSTALVPSIAESRRIGISAAKDLPWRFYAEGDEHVSRRR
jgi:DNA-3-methyladenine glycosylase